MSRSGRTVSGARGGSLPCVRGLELTVLPAPSARSLSNATSSGSSDTGARTDGVTSVRGRVVVPDAVLARIKRAGAVAVAAAGGACGDTNAALVVVVIHPMVPHLAPRTLVLPAVAVPGAAAMPGSCCWFAGVDVGPGTATVAPVLPPLLRAWERVVVVPWAATGDACGAGDDPILSQAAVAPQLVGQVLRQDDTATVADAERAAVVVGVRCNAPSCYNGSGVPVVASSGSKRGPAAVPYADVRAAVEASGWGLVNPDTRVVLHPHMDLLAPSAFGDIARHDLVDPFLAPYCQPRLAVACTALLRAAVKQAVDAAILTPTSTQLEEGPRIAGVAAL